MRWSDRAGRLSSRQTVLLGSAVALLGGAAWAFCFERRPLTVAPWLALVPLCLLLGQRRRRLHCSLHGLAFWLVAIPWIRPTLESYGGLPSAMALLLLVALCGYLGLFHLLFGILGGPVWRRAGALAPAAAAGLWVALEWLRAHLFTGFPWNLAAYAWVGVPGALELAPWIGAYGVSFLVVWANAAVARTIDRRSWRPAVAGLVPVGLLLAAAAWRSPPEGLGPQAGRTVHLIQPDLAVSLTWDPQVSRRDYQLVVGLSRAACDRSPGLLIWPESAAWPFSPERQAFLRRDLEELARRGCPVLLNAATVRQERSYNSALLVAGEGRAERADKRHLVPFGEYVPAPFKQLPFVGKLARNVGDFSPGVTAEPLRWDGERLGVSICYEVIFPGEVAATVRRGATILVTITNDGWYGDSSAPWQHFRAARFRAAENRRPLLRAALTGVSGVILADGSVAGQLGVGEQGVLTARLAGDRRLAPYSRASWLVPLLASILAGFAIFRASRRRAE